MDLLTEQIYHSILSYPLIFPSREQVLIQMYIVTGNGYEWENGKLKSSSEKERVTTEKEALSQIREKHYSYKDRLLSEFSAKLQENFRNQVKNQTLKLRDRVLNAKSIALGEKRDGPAKWIADSEEYSNIFKLPDNAQDEYVRGAVEILRKRVNGSDLINVHEESKVSTETYRELLNSLETRLIDS